MDRDEEPTAKVLFRVASDDGSVDVETLWAFDLGEGKYKLDNSPFYAYSVSWQDIVYAPFDKDEECPTFASVVSKSGNRTIRMKFESPIEPGNESDQVLQGLISSGCSYEGAKSMNVAINIPLEIDLMTIRDFLVEWSAIWEHADPTYETLYPDQT